MVILKSKWIAYARNQVDGDGTLLYDVTIEGQPKLTDGLNKFLAKADTGKNDIQVNQKAKYQDIINEFHENDIKSAVKQHLFGDKGKDNKLTGADLSLIHI